MATANYGWLKEYDGSTFFPGTKPAGNSEKPVYIGTNGLPVEIDHTIKSDVPKNAEFTDTKVTQKAAITTNGEYPVILANSTATTEETNAVNKTSTLKYNPSTKTLTTDTIDINSLKLNQNVYHFTDASGNIIATIKNDGITATNFKGKVNGYTIAKNLPSTAKLTDTTYTLSGALTDSNTTYTVTLTPSAGNALTAKIPKMTAATASAAGKAGLVPTPAAAKNTSFLRGDGTWSKSTDTFEVTGNATIGGTLDLDTLALNKDVYTFHDADNNAIATIDNTGITATNFKGKVNGYTIAKNLPSTAELTDTKVTSAANHYTPTANTASALSVDASSTTAATWGSTDLVTGVNIQRDAKGHVTGLTVDSIQMPAKPTYTDTNTTYDLTTSSSTTNGKINLVAGGSGSETDTITIKGSGATTVTSDASGNITVNSTNTTYNNATQTAAGLMSANDKKRLDNIEVGTWQPMPCTETTFVGPQVMNGYYTKIGNIVTITFQGYWVIGSVPPWDEINNGNTFYIDATTLPYRFAAAFINETTISETRTFYAGGGYVRGLKPMGDDDRPFSGFQLTNAGKIFPRISRRVDGKEYPGYMTCDMGDQVWITGSITYITDGAPEWGMEQWDSDM